MENKQLVCDLLANALRATRAGEDVLRIDYKGDTAVVVYNDDTTREINIACDSGIAMIQDISKTF